MGYELDFLAVGEKSQSGDAIALRYGNLINGTRDEQKVIVIDGGFQKDGENLVEHIKKYYKTDIIDLVISTHTDDDHIQGLQVVLNNMTVKRLWMHLPWEHSQDIKSLFVHGKITDKSLEARLVKNLESAKTLHELATEKNIPIEEPLQGITFDNGIIHVLGPSKDFYEAMLAHFRDMPKAKNDVLAQFSALGDKVVEAIRSWIEDNPSKPETLKDPAEFATSYENNSSTINYLKIDNHTFLLTADAGVEGLANAADYAKTQNIGLKLLNFLQCPHHGSRKNIGPTIMERVMGKTVYISAAKEGDPIHPSRRVINAFIRREANVFITAGKTLTQYSNAPTREGWVSAVSSTFFAQVEAD
jgi:beta-lactamase superfamily II metal-dependent hydrolase